MVRKLVLGMMLAVLGGCMEFREEFVTSANVYGMRRVDSSAEQVAMHRDRIPRLERPRVSENRSEGESAPFAVTSRPGKDASTFSIDVDTASYAMLRRSLREGRLPDPKAVRIEEMVNYFTTEDRRSSWYRREPFSIDTEVGSCPWNTKHRLVRIAMMGKEIEAKDRPGSNLVFLVDVSGSMDAPDRLLLLVKGLERLTKQLDRRDRIAIVTYAATSRIALDAIPGNHRRAIIRSLRKLKAGGSTNGGDGLRRAYDIARANRIEGGNNRVILCTDGDFNVGMQDRDELVRYIAGAADDGIDLTVLGFGTGNYKDNKLEALTNQGNGNYYYIDGETEARRVLERRMTGTLVAIAHDVKVQVFFNPEKIASWRLIGYENRVLEREDFNDDSVDAGDVGAGHSVVALYEITPAKQFGRRESDPNPFLHPVVASEDDEKEDGKKKPKKNDNMIRIRLRYKLPGEKTSLLEEYDVSEYWTGWTNTSRDFRWSAAVAGFGMLLRNETAEDLRWSLVRKLADDASEPDRLGERKELIELIDRARRLSGEE